MPHAGWVSDKYEAASCIPSSINAKSNVAENLSATLLLALMLANHIPPFLTPSACRSKASCGRSGASWRRHQKEACAIAGTGWSTKACRCAVPRLCVISALAPAQRGRLVYAAVDGASNSLHHVWPCRMAQAVLAREDPRETFLKSIPAKPGPMEVIYPVSRGRP